MSETMFAATSSAGHGVSISTTSYFAVAATWAVTILSWSES